MIKSKTSQNTDEPVGKLTQVEDFLPPPEDLVSPEPMEKVTLSLTKSSLEFFKNQARKNHTKYQRMIREVVDHYARKFQS